MNEFVKIKNKESIAVLDAKTGLKKEVENFISVFMFKIEDPTYSYQRTHAMFHQLMAAIRMAEIEEVPHETIKELLGPVRKLHGLSKAIRRMQEWPRGYPGDFETIEMMCNGLENNYTGNAILPIDYILCNSTAVQQHRNKIAWQGEQFMQILVKNPEARLLSVACGGSRDLFNISSYITSRNFTLVLNDIDKDALELSEKRLTGITPNLIIKQGSVFTSIKHLIPHAPFDLIVAGGLFDYLDKRHMVWLLSRLIKLLQPNGSLCFTNISKGIPYAGWMEYIANWKLIARDENDILDILKQAGSRSCDTISLKRDTTGDALLVKYTRLNSQKTQEPAIIAFEKVITSEDSKKMTASEKWDLLGPFVKRHGREAISYATLQNGMEYYVNEDGYIAYVTVQHPILSPRPKRIVLCDPVCDLKKYESFLKRFIQNHPDVAFGVISEECAKALRNMGFKINCIGYEIELSIQKYNTQGNWKELDLIKRARNEVKRKEITIREVDIAKVDKKSLDIVTREWLSQKKIFDREIWIYARKPVFEKEEFVRKFVAFDKDNNVAGYVFYDPMFNNGEVFGYSANTPRSDEKRYNKLITAIHMTAMDVFKKEGKKVLNLCLSPFLKLDIGTYNDDKMFRGFLEFTAKYGEEIYNFEGLSFHKSKYRGTEKPIYFASKSKMSTNELYLAFHAAGISKDYWSTMGMVLKGFLKKTIRF